MIVLINIIVIFLFMVGVGFYIKKRYKSNNGYSRLPTGHNKTGIYKDYVNIEVPKAGYYTLTETKSINFTAIIKEKKRYGDNIEVEYVKLVNAPSNYSVRIMRELKDTKELIPLNKIEWEYEVPDVLIKRTDFRALLNNRFVKIGKIEVKLDEDIERSEMLDIVIEESHESK